MGLGLGLGLKLGGGGSGGGSITPSKTLDFMAGTLDSDLTFVRATAGTYKNSSGKWVSAVSTVQRWHYHTASIFGLLIEPTTTNRMTDNNANPTTTSGWTKGGDAASTFAVVSDPSTLLADANIDLLCTSGKVYKLDNTLGVTTAYVDSDGVFNSVIAATVSAWISGGTGSLTRTGAGTPETLAFTASTPMVRIALSTVPNATTDKFRIVADAGQVVYFILPQMEATSFKEWYDNGTGYTYRAIPTSPIITTGATATRDNDVLYVASLNSKTWFDEQNYTVSMEYVPFGHAGSQHLFNISAGNNQNECAVEIRGVSSSSNYLRPRVRGNNIVDANQDFIVLGRPLIGKINRTAFSASPTEYANVSPVIVFPLSVMPFTQRPLPPTIMRIGSGATGYSSQFFGLVRKVEIYKVAKTSVQMGNDVLKPSQNIVMLAGQSLAESWFYSYETNKQNTGELKAIQVMDGYYPSNENILMDGARGASCLLLGEYVVGLYPYWFDDGGVAGGFADWGDAGLRFVQQLNMAKAAGATIKAVVWNQGQGGIGTFGVTKARHKAALVTLHQKIEEILGYTVLFIMEPLSRYSDAQAIRECYQELDADVLYPRMYQGPEVIDMALLGDNTHPTSAGMYVTVPRTMRKVMSVLGNTVSGGVDGASILSATILDDLITITIDHDAGTDFTPSTGIKGIWVFDDATQVFDGDTDSATRLSATQISVQLASAPSGVVTLYSIYGSCIVTDVTKFVTDNSTNNLILRSGVYTVTPETRISLQQAGIANVVAEWDATLLSSYAGSGATWSNIATTPADGSAQTDYDLTLAGLTFTGTAGDEAAYFLSAGLGSAVISGNTPFLRDLHKTTGGSNYGMGFFFEVPTAPSTVPIVSTHLTSSANGIEVALDTSIRHRQGYGAGNVSDTGGAIATNTLYALIIGHDHAGNQSCRFINTRTGTFTTHTFSTTTTDANGFFTLFGRTTSVLLMPTGSKLKGAFLLNTYPTNAIVGDILDVKNVVHGNTYA